MLKPITWFYSGFDDAIYVILSFHLIISQIRARFFKNSTLEIAILFK